MEENIKRISETSGNRLDLWATLVNYFESKIVVEVGVYKGDFAAVLLKECTGIEKYYMIDPWRNLDSWNKPANTTDEKFESFYQETLSRTQDYSEKREVLRGKTKEVTSKIPDLSLDFAYIDGDHTLKGICLDLINIWPKLREGGYIAGDDFVPTIWQHDSAYEPSMVHPFAIHFAEAMNATIYILPHYQFLIAKEKKGFRVLNYSGLPYEPSLRLQFIIDPGKKNKKGLKKKYPYFSRFLSKIGFLKSKN